MLASIPRVVLKWIQSLNLSIQIKNIKRDLGNGLIFAKIFENHFPGIPPSSLSHRYLSNQNKEIGELITATMYTGPSTHSKTQNWYADYTYSF